MPNYFVIRTIRDTIMTVLWHKSWKQVFIFKFLFSTLASNSLNVVKMPWQWSMSLACRVQWGPCCVFFFEEAFFRQEKMQHEECHWAAWHGSTRRAVRATAAAEVTLCLSPLLKLPATQVRVFFVFREPLQNFKRISYSAPVPRKYCSMAGNVHVYIYQGFSAM